MREIKYRAWDIGAERMIRDVHYAFLAGWLGAWTVTTVNSVFKQTAGRLIWLEYTGLHDKNGVEIYEGDIFKVEYDDGRPTAYIDVEFKCGGFVVEDDFGDYDITNVSWAMTEWEACGHEASIVGNIYENPELVATLPTGAKAN